MTSSTDMQASINFYKASLKLAGEKVNLDTAKSLKDVVGREYESHRARIYTSLGFRVEKGKNEACWNADLAVFRSDGTLVAFEEDKGHYVDSCFLDRAIIGMAKTADKMGESTPKMILNSFTRYNLIDKKMDENLSIFRGDIQNIIRSNFEYTHVNQFDRIKKSEWFKSSGPRNTNPFETFQDDGLIEKDIRFILSLNNL
jgi:hypothetical protein